MLLCLSEAFPYSRDAFWRQASTVKDPGNGVVRLVRAAAYFDDERFDQGVSELAACASSNRIRLYEHKGLQRLVSALQACGLKKNDALLACQLGAGPPVMVNAIARLIRSTETYIFGRPKTDENTSPSWVVVSPGGKGIAFERYRPPKEIADKRHRARPPLRDPAQKKMIRRALLDITEKLVTGTTDASVYFRALQWRLHLLSFLMEGEQTAAESREITPYLVDYARSNMAAEAFLQRLEVLGGLETRPPREMIRYLADLHRFGTLVALCNLPTDEREPPLDWVLRPIDGARPK